MIKNFEQYVNENLTSLVGRYKNNHGIRKEDILSDDYVRSFLEDGCNPEKITITIKNDKQVVNVVGNFVFDNLDSFKKLGGHLPFSFGTVTGYFSCEGCHLTTLEGCPEEVGGMFNCMENDITSLEGGPEKVGGDFNCSFNDLESLKGSPKEVGGNFNCHSDQLTSLEGCPEEVGGDFNCSGAKLKFSEEDVRKNCNVKGNIYNR